IGRWQEASGRLGMPVCVAVGLGGSPENTSRMFIFDLGGMKWSKHRYRSTSYLRANALPAHKFVYLGGVACPAAPSRRLDDEPLGGLLSAFKVPSSALLCF
ncbi:MAG TPA: hypothetical protein P5168_05830, partial [Candidatus Methanomethylicus sp.]|nr:hypothetical protein [Candidatus Methanomethylicus sp.]